MFFKLFLLFTIVPLAELALLIKIGTRLGAAPTIMLVLATGAAGAWMAREEGLRVLREFNGSVRRGEVPADPLLDGFLVVIGGVLLITPGIMTDIAGLMLVIPHTRALIRARIQKSLGARIEMAAYRPGPAGFHYTNIRRGPAGGDARRGGDDDVIDV